MHFGPRERSAHRVGHGAEVFADHHAMVALALERDDRHHLVQRVVNIGAIACGAALGHPEQAHQAHHMVNAQRARAAHVGAQGLDENTIAAGTQMVWPQRRQTPALAVGIELVGRRTDAGAGTKSRGLTPYIGAAAIDRHRQIKEQANAESERLATRIHPHQLLNRDPLQIEVIKHPIDMLRSERGDRGRSRVTVGLGPHRPAPDRRIDQMKVRLQRFEQRMSTQGLAALFDKSKESLAAGAARIGWSAPAIGRHMLRTEVREQELEYFELGGRHAGIVDQRCRSQLGEA